MIETGLPPLCDYRRSVLEDVVEARSNFSPGPADHQACLYLHAAGYIRRVVRDGDDVSYVATTAGRLEVKKPRP